jgi:glycosyltransferase involved in cell wall biosynthesis
MMRNKFKFIIPSYNNSDWIDYNIASVLNQTYTNWEVIYIDDNSSDDTLKKVTELVGNNPKYTIISNKENKSGVCNFFGQFPLINDDDIVVHLDGDDWLIDEFVLENLNNLYNKTDCWMSYGGLVAWDGSNYFQPFPLNTHHSDFVHKYKLYRHDVWRASHLQTYRGFLFKSIDLNVVKDLKNKQYYWHAADLAWQYAYMEISGKDKIQVVDFHTHVYNQHPDNRKRSVARESEDANKLVAKEIVNRKKHRQGLPAKRLPQINVIGTHRERNSIPTKFSYVYNQTEGEFDITLLQDFECINYINGVYGKLPGIVIADIHRPPHLSNHSDVYTAVLQNHDKFDYIFTYSKELLPLLNAIYRNGGYECVLNKSIHTQEYPNLADETLFKLYDKSKSVSIITSNKNSTPLHRFRTECVQFISDNNLPVDIFGVGFNQIQGKIEGLKDYKYSIAIENGETENYFTEKILDVFLTGTIPIYRGCPNIEEFFNPKGIIKFNTLEELRYILNNLHLYEISPDIIKENYEKALTFCYNNDRFFDKFINPSQLTSDNFECILDINEQRVYFKPRHNILLPVKIVVKDIDSHALMHTQSYPSGVLHKINYWVSPPPKHILDFNTEKTFGGITVEFYVMDDKIQSVDFRIRMPSSTLPKLGNITLPELKTINTL